MMESRQYLNFLRLNWSTFLVSLVISLITGLFYLQQLPSRFTQTQLLQISFDSDNLLSQQALVDQIITTTRSQNLHQALELDGSTDINIYKPSPLAINLIVESASPQIAARDLALTNQWLTESYDLSVIGRNISGETSRRYDYYLSLASLVGLGVGLLVSLTRSYFKHY